ncbi:MAG: hypothetical protein Q4G13_04265 [Moraxella sp.]|nr:hypothetical protein [Moraxella sp.]
MMDFWQAHQARFFELANPKQAFDVHSPGEHSLGVYSLGTYSLTPHSPTPNIGEHAPNVVVCASYKDNALQLSYFIERCAWLDIPAPSQQRVGVRQDYLWQADCLECFFDTADDTSYLELNVAFDGSFNLYQFDDYRTPSIMPPQQAMGELSTFVADELTITKHGSATQFSVRHLTVKIATKMNTETKTPTSMQLHHIHPCVILHLDHQPIYYAIQHACPPDFHDKAYWQRTTIIGSHS